MIKDIRQKEQTIRLKARGARHKATERHSAKRIERSERAFTHSRSHALALSRFADQRFLDLEIGQGPYWRCI